MNTNTQERSVWGNFNFIISQIANAIANIVGIIADTSGGVASPINRTLNTMDNLAAQAEEASEQSRTFNSKKRAIEHKARLAELAAL